MPALMRKVCSRRSGGKERRYCRSASMAHLQGPSPRRTCCMGAGRTFQATFSRPAGLPFFSAGLTTGSWKGAASAAAGRIAGIPRRPPRPPRIAGGTHRPIGSCRLLEAGNRILYPSLGAVTRQNPSANTGKFTRHPAQRTKPGSRSGFSRGLLSRTDRQTECAAAAACRRQRSRACDTTRGFGGARRWRASCRASNRAASGCISLRYGLRCG